MDSKSSLPHQVSRSDEDGNFLKDPARSLSPDHFVYRFCEAAERFALVAIPPRLRPDLDYGAGADDRDGRVRLDPGPSPLFLAERHATLRVEFGWDGQ